MKKTILWILIVVLAAVFVFALVKLWSVLHVYWAADRLYEETAAAVVETVVPASTAEASEAEEDTSSAGGEASEETEVLEAPITVDFDALLAINPDVVGWLYCEGTAINYPVMQGDDNSYYLHHNYEGTYSGSASIFVDCYNRRGFQDANTIIYGHAMKNGSMFGGLGNYAYQDYYEEHPVMWLLTPEQDYEVVLFSGHVTAADSEIYSIYDIAGEPLNEYIEKCVELSDFQADVDLSGAEKLVVLSTCAYVFTNARYVVHGMLVPCGGESE